MTVSATTARSDAYTGLVHWTAKARKSGADDDLSPAYRYDDRIEISATAHALAAVQERLGHPRLAARHEFPAELAAFRSELGNRFQAAGIDTSVPFDLWVDASGKVRVAGDHPDKLRIEALLAGDPGLANLARQLAGTVSLMRALDEHMEFARAYAQDPQLAVVQFAHLLAEAKGDRGFRFAGDEMSLLSPVLTTSDTTAAAETEAAEDDASVPIDMTVDERA